MHVLPYLLPLILLFNVHDASLLASSLVLLLLRIKHVLLLPCRYDTGLSPY